MAEKKLEIQIAATGADAAAAEIAKVSQAAEDAAKPTTGTTGFGGMLDGVPERAEEATKSIQELKEAASQARAETAGMAEDLGDAFEETAEKAQATEENVDRIAQVKKAQAVAQLASVIGNMGQQLQLAAKDAEGFDASLAASMRSAGENIENVSGKLNSMAQGFAVGGPVGAGLALNAELLKDAVIGWFGMAGAMDAAAAAEARALEMQGKLNLALAGVVDPALAAVDASNELADSYDKERSSLDALITANRSRNEILNATDDANAAARDREDAAAIRAGAAPEDVKAARALYNADVAKAKIDREFEAKQQEKLRLRDLANAAENGVRDLEANPATDPKELEDRRREAEIARRQATAATEALATQGATSDLRKRAIDDRAAGTVEESQASKAARLEREKQAADQKAEREARMEETKQARENARANRAGEQGQRGAAEIGRRAEKLLPEGVSAEFRKAVQGAAERLQDGDQGGELKELARLLNQLAGSTNSAVDSVRTELAAALNKISILEGQIKAGRTGK